MKISFENSYNSGWIQKIQRKENLYKTFKISWTIFSFVPLIIFSILFIDWFINIAQANQWSNFISNAWNFINITLNKQIFTILILVIAIGDFIVWTICLFKNVQNNSINFWISIGLTVINLIFIKLITINTIYVLIKAIWEVCLTYSCWIIKIIRIQKDINNKHN